MITLFTFFQRFMEITNTNQEWSNALKSIQSIMFTTLMIMAMSYHKQHFNANSL